MWTGHWSIHDRVVRLASVRDEAGRSQRQDAAFSESVMWKYQGNYLEVRCRALAFPCSKVETSDARMNCLIIGTMSVESRVQILRAALRFLGVPVRRPVSTALV